MAGVRTAFGYIALALMAASFPVHAQDADAVRAKMSEATRNAMEESATVLPRGNRVQFSFMPEGPGVKMVYDHWKKGNGPESKIWKQHQMLPQPAIGYADVNGDGKVEIFVRNTEPYWGLCDDPTEEKAFACLMHIYALTPKGLVELGSMLAADPVIVLPQKTENINSIYVVAPGVKGQTYVWNGKSYALRP